MRREPSSANTAVEPKPDRNSLLAWPIGRDTFAVFADSSVRLDGSEPSSESEHERRNELEALLLRMAIHDGDVFTTHEADNAPLAKLGAPVEIPGWGRPATGKDIRRCAPLRGATLVFSDTNPAKSLDVFETAKLAALGASRLIFFHPQRHKRSIISLRVRHLSRAARLRSAAALWGRRIAAFSRLRAYWGGRMCYSHGPIEKLPPIKDVELSGRFMLFEGFRQLLPVPISHEEIAEFGGGRYSIWSQHCFFSPSRKGRSLPRLHWIVEKTAETEPWLAIIPEVPDPTLANASPFLDALAAHIAMDQDLPRLVSLEPGDRVVVLTHDLPPGGAERQWCYLAAGLKALGFDVSFVVTGSLRGPNGHYVPLLKSLGIEPIRLDTRPLGEMLAHLPRAPDVVRLLSHGESPFGFMLDVLVSYLAHVKPKAVFAQLEPLTLLAGVAGHLANVPKIALSFRNYNPSHFSYLSSPWLQPCYRILTASPRITLTGNSRAGNEDYARWIGVPPDTIAWIPNAIEPGDFTFPAPTEQAKLRDQLQLRDGEPTVLGVFRLSEEKRPRLFVQVCALIAKRIPSFRAFIVGVGPLQLDTQQAIAEAGLERQVTMLGRRDDVTTLLSVASIVLLTSRHEGMPNVLMEAQLTGVPVVSTRVGGAPDCTLDGVTGFIVDRDDAQGLADACVHLLTNPALAAKMGQRGAAHMRRFCSKERLAMLHVKLLSEGVEAIRPFDGCDESRQASSSC